MSDFERKGLFGLTYPLFLFSFMSIGVTFVDQILLSNYSDQLAAAVSLANQILGVAYDASGLIAVGTLIMIAQYLGRDEIEKAKTVVVIGIQASMLLCLGLSIILVVGADYFASWINTPPDIHADVVAYVYVIAGAMLFNGAITTATAALRGFGHTLIILALGIAANIIYIFLEYALIYGKFGFPELGVYGAALSTLFVRLGSVFILFWVLQRYLHINLLKIPVAFFEQIKKLIKISYPSVSENMIYNLYQLSMVSLITVLGTNAVVTRSYTLTILSLLTVINMVIAQGTEVLVGYDRGANKYDDAFRRGVRTAVITGVVTFFFSLLIFWQAEFFVGLFTKEVEVIIGVKQLLLLNLIVAPFNTINLILFAALKAVGDVNRPVLVNISLTFLIALPLGYVAVAVLELGVVGLWYAYIAEEVLKAMGMLILWWRRGWKKYELISERNT